MLISDAAIHNKTTVAVITLIILLVGGYCYFTLPREAAPDVPIPNVLITTAYEGVSPEDIESSVTQKIEEELSGVKGLKEVRSISAEGMSFVIVEFLPDVVVEDALQFVRARVDLAKPELPEEADEPSIQEFNIAEFPIILISIAGDISAARMKLMADELEDELELIPGILNVDVLGAVEREIRLEMDPDRVALYHLTVPEMLSLIPSENVNISAGGLETEGTKFYVRVPAEFVEPEEVDRLLLTVRDGRPIYLSDVATVVDTFKDRTSFSRLNGRPSVTLSIQKRIGANAIAVSDAVRQIVAEANKSAPAGVTVSITDDISDYIRNMVKDLENNILSGLVLVVAVLILFLGFRSSVIVSLAIPLSMLISFAVIKAIGFTLNMIVLFSLILALGMLVDNAIVIVENIYRHRQLGYNRLQAAIQGTREVAWPITTSTITTIVAFLPLAFWPEMVGDFMKYLPITLIITLSSSLFVALVINPVVCAMVIGGQRPERETKHWFMHAYGRALELTLHHRIVSTFLALALLAGVAMFYFKFGYGVEFFPTTDPDRAVINVRFPQGTNVRETDRMARIVEQRIEPYKEYLKHVVTNVGSPAGGMGFDLAGGGGTGGEHTSDITLVFPDYEVREKPSMEVLTALRQDLSDLAGAEIKVARQKEGPPTGDAVSIQIIGDDFAVLEALNHDILARIAGTSGLVNLRSDLEATRPELVFNVDRRRAMMLGVTSSSIGNFLKMAIFGREVGTFREFSEEYDITLRLPLSQRISIDDLLRLRVPNAFGSSVPLSSLGSFDYRGGFGTINHVNQKRVVTITGEAEGRLSNDVLKDVQKEVGGATIPEGYQIRYAGEKEEQDKSQAFLQKAFIIALFLITLVLVAQFNSLLVPFVIMTTVLLSLIGVFVGLLFCRLRFGIIMTGIGVISLAGVVVNNAIVLLAYTRQLQDEGMELVTAARTAGETRLRPVLLTAVTTILGLVPMAIGVSFDFHTMEWATRSQSSEWWRNMAITVIFGLTVATILTLVVVPTLYVMLTSWLKAARGKSAGASEPGAE